MKPCCHLWFLPFHWSTIPLASIPYFSGVLLWCLGHCFWYFNVHTDPLSFLLKSRSWLHRPGVGPGSLHLNKFPDDAYPVCLWPRLWVAGVSRILQWPPKWLALDWSFCSTVLIKSSLAGKYSGIYQIRFKAQIKSFVTLHNSKITFWILFSTTPFQECWVLAKQVKFSSVQSFQFHLRDASSRTADSFPTGLLTAQTHPVKTKENGGN